MIGLKITQEPAAEPISLAVAKAYLGLDPSDTSSDSLIQIHIKAARRFCENYTNRSFITQTLQFWMDRFPAGDRPSMGWFDGTREGALVQILGSTAPIEFPRPPFQSLVSLETFGTDDQASTFDKSNVVENPDVEPGIIFLKVGQIWPVNLRPRMAVKVTYKAGYGDTADSLPGELAQACLLLVSHFFDNRQPISEGAAIEAPLSVRALLDPYKVRTLR